MIDITLERAVRVKLGPWWHRQHMRADEINRIYLVESGVTEVWTQTRKYGLRPGRFLLIPARTIFGFRCPRHAVKHYVHFRSGLTSGLPLSLVIPEAHDIPCPDRSLAIKQMARLQAIYQGKLPANNGEAEAIVRQILAWFASNHDIQLELNPKQCRLLPVLRYVEAHLGDQLDAATLAAQVHLERSYFCKEFRSCLGETPAQWVRQRRIEAAMQLLRSTNESLDSIASRLGFCDAFHFSRVFKTETGNSPSAYRKQAQSPTPFDLVPASPHGDR